MDQIVKTISLEEAPEIMQGMLAGKTSGRYLVKTIL
jgi:D-arabinose 1-dehydrogenase-like Zn-dependent alcohol dehydrogenase